MMGRSPKRRSLAICVLAAGAWAVNSAASAQAGGGGTDVTTVLGVDVPIENDRALTHFHAALRRTQAGDGKTRVLVYGASHVASELFTGTLRRELQRRFGDGGHGFVLPMKPWPGYRRAGLAPESNRPMVRRWAPKHTKVTDGARDAYGLAGVFFETDRQGSRMELIVDDDGSREARGVDFYYMKQPNGGRLDLRVDGRREARVSTAASALAVGYEPFELAGGSHTIEILHRGGGPVRVFGLTIERPGSGVVLDSLGVSGARARYQLLWDEAIHRDQLAHRSPDLVVLAYGTNESGDDDVPIERYEAELRRVITRVRETLPNTSCVLVGPSDRPIPNESAVEGDPLFLDRPRTHQIVDVQRRVARELGCGFFDLVAFSGGPLSLVDWAAHDPPFASSDHVHFTRLGYERMGEAFLNALLRGLPQ